MARLIVLLRGVNLAGRNRVTMPQLREALEGSGFRASRQPPPNWTTVTRLLELADE